MEQNNQTCGHSCSGHCSGCHIEENGCPVCGNQGIIVPFETVEHLANSFIKPQLKAYKDEEFFLCIHRACKVAYYTNSEAKIFVNQLDVPIWFKHDKDEYIVCYCRNITLDNIIEAVNNLDGEVTKEKVIKYLNKEEKVSDCLHNNPTGTSCDKLFENAIKYAISHKDDNK